MSPAFYVTDGTDGRITAVSLVPFNIAVIKRSEL